LIKRLVFYEVFGFPSQLRLCGLEKLLADDTIKDFVVRSSLFREKVIAEQLELT